LGNVGSEIAPVTAVLGAQLAQDVINVLGGRQQPIQNMVVFNGETMEAPMYALHPEGVPVSNAAEAGIILAGDPGALIPGNMPLFQPGVSL